MHPASDQAIFLSFVDGLDAANFAASLSNQLHLRQFFNKKRRSMNLTLKCQFACFI